MRHKLIVIYGPTAVGKTDTSNKLGRKLDTCILSADSRQCYSDLTIGSARPIHWEVPYFNVNSFSLWDDCPPYYSAGKFEKDGLEYLERLFRIRTVAILTGGSMLYIDALCYGLDDFPPPNMALRESLNKRLAKEGVESLANELQTLDPVTWERIDRKNGARVLRALEVTMQSGKPYSEYLKKERNRKHVIRGFDLIKVGLMRPWEELTMRINDRVDKMVEDGLEEEVQMLERFRNTPPLKTVGYKEFFEYFDGKVTLEEAIENIKTNTYRYAKRQMRWWERDKEIKWFHPDDYADILKYIKERLPK